MNHFISQGNQSNINLLNCGSYPWPTSQLLSLCSSARPPRSCEQSLLAIPRSNVKTKKGACNFNTLVFGPRTLEMSLHRCQTDSVPVSSYLTEIIVSLSAVSCNIDLCIYSRMICYCIDFTCCHILLFSCMAHIQLQFTGTNIKHVKHF